MDVLMNYNLPEFKSKSGLLNPIYFSPFNISTVKQPVDSDYCMTAITASMFNVPFEQVPKFIDLAKSDVENGIYDNVNTAFSENYDKYLNEYGLSLLIIPFKYHDEFIKQIKQTFPNKDYHYIVGGISDRNVKHVVIYSNGEPFFDPHQSNSFLKNPEDIILILLK